MSRTGDSREMESRLVVAYGWEFRGGVIGIDGNGYEVSLGVI